jgi:ABC-2 type transport system permease protein
MPIARRELGGYFQTPVGWVVLTAFLVLNGFFFASMVGLYNYQSLELASSPWSTQQMNVNDYLVAPYFANTGVILLFLCPAVTMRLLAEDRRSGALELLLTSPVSTLGIVVGKYLGAMGFVSIMLAGTLPCMAMVWWLGDPDAGAMFSGYLAVWLLSGAFVSVGLLASAFTRSQVIALVVGFALLLLFWVLTWADPSSGEGVTSVIASMSMLNHMENMSRGLLHLKDLVYYASFIGFFLFASWQRIESERWT